eukprot:TRINITY_DN23148_c0_g3_i1.p1 TRINITY_DN23148_c0_g3~~TRINITY_DN23148_c0_g3_i1.p1  ORF type:complete len:414 (+),score=37.38 TRINITY_DN23148_c0_g3_i1:71-1243(+)
MPHKQRCEKDIGFKNDTKLIVRDAVKRALDFTKHVREEPSKKHLIEGSVDKVVPNVQRIIAEHSDQAHIDVLLAELAQLQVPNQRTKLPNQLGSKRARTIFEIIFGKLPAQYCNLEYACFQQERAQSSYIIDAPSSSDRRDEPLDTRQSTPADVASTTSHEIHAASSLRCPAGHDLEITEAEEGVCDRCSLRVRTGDEVMSCEACNWYVCGVCLLNLELENRGSSVSDGNMSDAVSKNCSSFFRGPIHLLEFTRSPQAFFDALMESDALAACRLALTQEEYEPLLPSGAKVFVFPDQYEAVVAAIGSYDLKPRHVVVSHEFEANVMNALADVGRGVRAKGHEVLPPSPAIVSRTFITVIVPSSLRSEPVNTAVASTTDANARVKVRPRKA